MHPRIRNVLNIDHSLDVSFLNRIDGLKRNVNQCKYTNIIYAIDFSTILEIH